MNVATTVGKSLTWAAFGVWLIVARPAAADWPTWRGPTMQGHSQESGFATEWTPQANIRWRVELPDEGNSTPIVVGDRIFVSCATDEGRRRSLICYARDNGEQVWMRDVEFAEEEQTHRTNPQCSSSPVTDGERVVVWHGSAGLFCYDLEGNELWQRDLGKFEHIWGVGSSPIIFEDLVILSAGPGLTAYVIAVDKRSGEPQWRRDLEHAVSETVEQYRGSWSTPVVHTVDGQPLLFLSLPQRLHVLNPSTGDDVWHCDGLSDLAYTSPLVDDNLVVTMCGYGGPALAVKLGGRGDVTDSHKLWETRERNPQRVGSGTLIDGYVYLYNESGVLWCIQADTGEVTWKERVGGKSWSSGCYVGGLLYVINMDGTTVVVRPNPQQCDIVAENELGEMTRASLAFSRGQIFVRTYEALYCIEASK